MLRVHYCTLIEFGRSVFLHNIFELAIFYVLISSNYYFLFQHIGWWSPTIIRADDREAVHIPNHKFTVNVVRNLTQKTHWRVKTHLAISHLDVNKINVRCDIVNYFPDN